MSTQNYFDMLFGYNYGNSWMNNGFNGNNSWNTWNPMGNTSMGSWNPFQQGFGNNFPPYWALLTFWMNGGQWPQWDPIDNGGGGGGGNTNTGPATSDAILDDLSANVEADLYDGADQVFVAANSGTHGNVNKGDVLLKANGPAYDYDINGDGVQDKYVEIDGVGYYVVSSKAQNDALIAEHGPGTYLPVVDRDYNNDGTVDNGYIRINPDGTVEFIEDDDMVVVDPPVDEPVDPEPTSDTPVASVILSTVSDAASADLYSGDEKIFKAANSDANGHVNQGDLLIEATDGMPAGDYDINGDGTVNKRVTIDGKDYYVILTASDNAVMAGIYGPGDYLPVINRDVTGDGEPDNGFLRIMPDGKRAFVSTYAFGTEDKKVNPDIFGLQVAIASEIGGGDYHDKIRYKDGDFKIQEVEYNGKTYRVQITGYVDADGDGENSRGDPVHVQILLD